MPRGILVHHLYAEHAQGVLVHHLNLLIVGGGFLFVPGNPDLK